MPVLRLIVIVLIVLLFMGCAQNSVDRYYELQSAANTARNSIGHSHDAGLITDQELIVLDQYEKAVRASLDSVRDVLPKDDQGNLDPNGATADEQSIEWHLEQAERVLEALLKYFDDLEQEEQDNDRSGNSGDSEIDLGSGAGHEGILSMDRYRDRAGRAERPVDRRAA